MNAARRRLQRGIIILPSAFTVGNLFLGIWAIIAASRGAYEFAGWLIVVAAFADMLDGRVARFTATGTAFGEELDSLVDAVSFGVAPGLIVYFIFLGDSGWGWVLSFIYTLAAVTRLARFNIEQAGQAKVAFHGLPSPIAGVTLATYYAFTETPFFRAHLADVVPVSQVAAWMMLGIAVLMVSNVLYPVVPRFSPRTWGGRLAIVLALGSIVAAFTVPEYYFFPISIVYITWGLVRTVVLGFMDRLPDRDPLLDEPEDEDEEEVRELDYGQMHPRAAFRREPRAYPPEETT